MALGRLAWLAWPTWSSWPSEAPLPASEATHAATDAPEVAAELPATPAAPANSPHATGTRTELPVGKDASDRGKGRPLQIVVRGRCVDDQRAPCSEVAVSVHLNVPIHRVRSSMCVRRELDCVVGECPPARHVALGLHEKCFPDDRASSPV